MYRTLIRCAAACLLVPACAHHPVAQNEPHGPPLSAEAQAMLARALQQPESSGVVVDLAAFEETGLMSRRDALKRAAQLLVMSVPWIATSEEDPEMRRFLGRFTVSAAALREWADWPDVRGLAISLPDVARAAESGEPPVSRAVVVLAVAQTKDANRQLLQGVSALGRASLAEAQRRVRFEVRGDDVCLVEAEGEPFCIRPGDGVLLMGSPDAMSHYQRAVPPPAAAAETAFSDAEAQAEPVILHARVVMRDQGTANLFVRGRKQLGIYASLESKSPLLLARAEQAVRERLDRYDAQRAQQMELVTASLAEMKAALEADEKAPGSLKQVVQTLTPEKVLDPHGWWQKARASVKTERIGERFAASVVIPPGAVSALGEALKKGGGALGTSGVLAAIAVPGFIEFQCRAKQAEAKRRLEALLDAQRAFAQKRGRYAKNLDELGLGSEEGSRYVVCLGQTCTRCDGPDCPAVEGENPCVGMTGVGQTLADGFQACAYGNTDDDDALDIWIVDDRGAPENGQNDCAD